MLGQFFCKVDFENGVLKSLACPSQNSWVVRGLQIMTLFETPIVGRLLCLYPTSIGLPRPQNASRQTAGGVVARP